MGVPARTRRSRERTSPAVRALRPGEHGGGAVSRGCGAASERRKTSAMETRGAGERRHGAHLEARNARTEVREERRGARRGTLAVCPRATAAFMAVTACMVHSTVARRLPSFLLVKKVSSWRYFDRS